MFVEVKEGVEDMGAAHHITLTSYQFIWEELIACLLRWREGKGRLCLLLMCGRNFRFLLGTNHTN